MLKSGLIIGVIMLVLAIGSSLISPLCVLCLTLFAGVGAGYLAGVFDIPLESGQSAKIGAGAGAIAGVGAWLGHLVGGAANAVIVGPEATAQLMRDLGLPASVDPSTYYAAALGGGCCLGLIEIGLMAGLGALGGLLWFRLKRGS
jgi:hypothetical protein